MIKNYILLGLIILLLISGVFMYFTVRSNIELKNNWSISENNYKASNRKNLSYKLTIKQMNLSKDSDDIKMLEFKDRLKLKDSKIASLMHLVEVGGKVDTIITIDTLFVENLKLDTIIGDKWIQNRLQLQYPGTIIITDSMYNEKNIVWSNIRETIDPPKKFFICRWFQKKQTVVEIKIEDLNPYFKTREFKYNTIIK